MFIDSGKGSYDSPHIFEHQHFLATTIMEQTNANNKNLGFKQIIHHSNTTSSTNTAVGVHRSPSTSTSMDHAKLHECGEGDRTIDDTPLDIHWNNCLYPAMIVLITMVSNEHVEDECVLT